MSDARALRVLFLCPVAAAAIAACSGDDTNGGYNYDAGSLPDVGAHDTGADVVPGLDATTDAPAYEAGYDATYDSGYHPDTGSDAGNDSGSTDSGSDAGADADADASGTVAPVCDGFLGPGEYGGAQNQQTTTSGQTWYMTWDAQKLYIAITSANVAEASILYLSGPLPAADAGADGGDDAGDAGDAGDAATDAGAPMGHAYDGTNLARIGFPPKLVVYAKSTYNEYRSSDGAGTWSAATANAIQVCVGGGTTREYAIPWSYLNAGGARPPSFAWLGYLTSATGFVYGQIPTDNPAGTIGVAASYPWFYAVEDASITAPFASKRSN